jgi:hypothetical protein
MLEDALLVLLLVAGFAVVLYLFSDEGLDG